jgi:hypothetical protein
MSSLGAKMRAAVLHLLAAIEDDGQKPEPARESVSMGDWEIIIQISKRQDIRALREVERAAVSAATSEFLPVKVLARKAGYVYGSFFRQAVAELIRMGLLERGLGGVRHPR